MNKKIIFGIVVFFAFAFLLYTFANPLEDEEGSKFLNDDGNNKVNNVDKNDEEDDNTSSEVEKNMFTIKFNSSGGNSINSIKVANGKITTLPTPKRDGYVFLGWYNDSTKYTVGNTINKDMTLTAKWEKTDNTSNNSNGTNMGNNNTNNSGSQGGSTNGGNNSGNNGGNNQGGGTTPTPVVEYTISFDTNGGNSISPIKVVYGKITSLPTPVRSGYVFLGWFNGDVEYRPGIVISGDMTLTAKWEKENSGNPDDSKPSNTVSNVDVSSNDSAVEDITISSQTPNDSKLVTEIRLAGTVSKRELGAYSINISLQIPDLYDISDVEGKVKVKVLTNEYGITTGVYSVTRSDRSYILPIAFTNDAISGNLPLKVEVDWLGTGSPVMYKLYFNGINYRVN